MDRSLYRLKIQVSKVIKLLEERLENDPNRPILKELYNRYVRAEEILSNEEGIEKIFIEGGCRAYLDTFSNYANPLFYEMNKAEEMILEVKRQ